MTTMRFTVGLLMASAAGGACSGRYEVGGNDAATGGSGGRSSVGGPAAGGAYVGPSSQADSAFAGEPMTDVGEGGTFGVGGSSDAGPGAPGEFGSQCVSSGAPPPLSAPFAKPDVVWSRLARLIWGKPAAPPETLPATTTYAWATKVVNQGFDDVNAKLGAAPGAKLFVSQWLHLGLTPAEASGLTGHWDTLLGLRMPALEVLLRAPLGETGRVGVFTEPTWLGLHPRISSRGNAMLDNVLQQPVPPSPPGIETARADPTLPDREGLVRILDQPVCAACHHIMDSVGYSLGHFGADGAYRTLDHGQPIDTTGSISFGPGTVMFDGIADFGAKLADRCEPNLALADGFLKVAIDLAGFPQQQQAALFTANFDRMRQAFVANGRTYPALVLAFAQSSAVLMP